MNLSGVVGVHDLPWWGWVVCAAGTGFLAMICVAFGAISKRSGHGVVTMLAAGFLLVCLFCTVNGIVQLFEP